MSSLLKRLQRALLVLRCSGDPIFVHGTGATDELQTTRGGCIEASNSLPSIGWRFCHGLHHCDRCPRFEAYRQGLAARKDGHRDLSVSIGSEQIHTNVGHRDRESAQVDQVDKEDPGSRCGLTERDLQAQSSPVLDPVSPGVVDAEHGTQQRDGKGDVLENGLGFRSHAGTVTEAAA